MASPLTNRALQSIADTGFARAKKLSDLAIKTNTDSSGSPTARGYEQAISYLQPFIESGKENESLDAQRLLAGYNNSLDKLSSKQRDQAEATAAFRLQEIDSYFTTADGDTGGFRNPGSLIGPTSEALDGLVVGVINAIEQKQANGDSTTELNGYLNDLNKRADTMRDLKNKYENGELKGKTLDGFGYYVDTNPLDGSVRRAALLPVGLAPDNVSSGYRRIEATASVGDALLPVYAPATKDAVGASVARIGDATWSGSDSGALTTGDAKMSKSLFKEGAFSIEDAASYPVRKNSVDKGSFGKGFIGRDDQGNPVESIFYRGNDNKLYSVDQSTIDQFKQDPLLSRKLDGYVTQFSPSEIKELSKEAIPFSEGGISRESKLTGLRSQADLAKAEADRMENMSFFGKFKDNERVRNERRTPLPSPSMDNTNTPNAPEEPTVSDSTPDIVDQGKSFFRKAASFFGGRPMSEYKAK